VTVTPFQIVLLIVSWITALVTLVIFLESWFALTRKSRLGPVRSNSDSGLVTVLVPLEGDCSRARRTLESLLDQSYPLIDIVPVYCGEDRGHSLVAREFSSLRARASVTPLSVPFRLQSASDRIRALEQAQNVIRGAWILVVDSDVALEPHAVESALEFARDREITALALTPGVACRSYIQKLVAPSLEWFVRMMRVVDRGREQIGRLQPAVGFMMFHGDTHSIINRMNRLPGILNEAGWTLWSYRVEGLRTFQGDGSGWIYREATPRSLLSRLEHSGSPNGHRRTLAFLLGSAAIAVVSVAGIIVGILAPSESLVGHGILYLSAFSYSLMATSYFLYSRRLNAATWFAPLWFLAHCWALLLVLAEPGRSRPPVPDMPVLSGSGSEVSTRR